MRAPSERQQNSLGSRATRFKPGQSGNAEGRPKLPPRFRAALVRSYRSPSRRSPAQFMGRLGVEVRAANIALNRKFGILKQTVESTGSQTRRLPEAVARRMGSVRTRRAMCRRPGRRARPDAEVSAPGNHVPGLAMMPKVVQKTTALTVTFGGQARAHGSL